MGNKENELPKVKYESKIEVNGLNIRVFVLDDGRRVIPQDDMKRAIEFLGISPMDIAIKSLFK